MRWNQKQKETYVEHLSILNGLCWMEIITKHANHLMNLYNFEINNYNRRIEHENFCHHYYWILFVYFFLIWIDEECLSSYTPCVLKYLVCSFIDSSIRPTWAQYQSLSWKLLLFCISIAFEYTIWCLETMIVTK